MRRFIRNLMSGPNRMLATFGVVIAGSIAVLFLVDLNARYRDAIAGAKQEARNYAEVLAQHTAGAFSGVDRVLRAAEIVQQQANDSRRSAVEEARRIHDALRNLQQTSPLIRAVSWTDAQGNKLVHSYDRDPKRHNVADLPQFTVQRDNPNAGLFISPPYHSLEAGSWIVAASRRLNNVDGSFAGIALAPLDVSYFANIFRSLHLGQGGAVMLFHSSGVLLAREPLVPEFIGRSFAKAELFARHLPQATTGAYEVEAYYGDTQRIAGYAAVPHMPLVMLVSFNRAEVLAPWYRHLGTFGPMVAFVVGVILLGTFLLMRQTRRNADKSRTLWLTLETMSAGLSQFDRAGRLVICNSRYREMYGLTREQTRPGTSLRALLTASAANGTGLEPAPDYVERRLRELLGGKSSRAVNHMQDGRIIAVNQEPTHDGGWVGIHHDITAEKRTQAEVTAKSEALERANLRFDAALTNLPVGLCMYDGDQRLIVCNARYREMYDLSADQVRPGTTLRAVLEARVAAGMSPDDAQEYIDQRLKEVAEAKAYHVVNELRDGRMIQVTHQPMEEGGWVAIHEDVTAEKLAEAGLIKKSEELRRANMRFDAALNNMSQGLCMYDAEQRIVVANNRFAEIYGLTAEQIRAGLTVRQLVEYRIANGSYTGTVEEYVGRIFEEATDIQTHAGGRVVSIQRLRLPDGSVLTTHEDITDRRQSEAKVAFMAHHDLLTGLANRTFFMEKIEEAGARLRRRGEAFSVFMLDLDRFKDVNDSLGHPAGDALLKEMAQRLRSSLRETDVLARLGGDEFAILQGGETHQRDSAIMLAVRINEVVARPFELEGRRVTIGTSIGIALAPQDGVDPDDLIKKADLALYRTKSQGRNGFNFFDANMTAEADARHQLENEMREGIARNEFELFYQPMYDAETRAMRGAEALVRWRHPQKGLVPPDRFIPLAEDTGLIVQLGGWILQKACTDAAAWPDHVKVAVNLSSMQFRKGDLFDIILCALVESGLPPERLEVEITESVLLENEANYATLLQQLKNIGVAIVLDDFGTGYSSLGYLTKFPVDKIKIDKSFTQGLIARAECAAVIASVLTLARGLDIATTAEGVETEDQYDMLRAAGVNFVQGYLFCRPCPAAELRFSPIDPELFHHEDSARASAA
ncbi:MAG TPA: PAS-domain containing protein [Xanthobacteraceae bacterium]|nr:PAS-domain containing protein [Xanthobacteraceae bacterium]